MQIGSRHFLSHLWCRHSVSHCLSNCLKGQLKRKQNSVTCLDSLSYSYLIAKHLRPIKTCHSHQTHHTMSPQRYTVDEAKYIWHTADAVCFDVDSTVCQDEAIDELAKYCGVENQVKQMTLQAMGGGVCFRDALRARLNIINPSRSQLDNYIAANPPKLTPGIKELVQSLHRKNVPVYLVSGGFRSVIEPAAKQLNIPFDNIYANSLAFFYNGSYAGFDESEPTSETGGKRVVVSRLIEDHGYENLVIIGDGATDMEACPPARVFIGFGGNVVRDSIKHAASWYITDFSELTGAMQNGFM